LLAAWAAGALAADPSLTCESSKNKEAGKYSYCRQRAEARYAITGNAQGYQHALATCAASIAARWSLIETKANGACPKNADLPAIQAAVDAHTKAIAMALAGGALPACPDDLATCADQFGTCESDFGTCQTGLGSCLAGQQTPLLSTGQTTCRNSLGNLIPCAGTGQDGELQKGLARSYKDNGDGTISDNQTGLMWEKLSDDGSIHDKDDAYSWSGAFVVKIAGLNQQAFAGYTDWRLPNVNELLTLVAFGATNPDPVSPESNTGCVPGCTITMCSCVSGTYQERYWSSTSCAGGLENNAWVIGGGELYGLTHDFKLAVRAVRGGF
jgi:hypothetical protein